MLDQIRTLDDPTALRIASAFARAQLHRTELLTDSDPALAEALQSASAELGAVAPTELGASAELGAVVPTELSDADLARAALAVLAEQDEHREAIRQMIAGPSAESFVGVELMAAVVIGLVVLQTRVKIDRDKQGRCRVQIEKPSATEDLLKTLIGAVVPRLGK